MDKQCCFHRLVSLDFVHMRLASQYGRLCGGIGTMTCFRTLERQPVAGRGWIFFDLDGVGDSLFRAADEMNASPLLPEHCSVPRERRKRRRETATAENGIPMRAERVFASRHLQP
jgi:hypothetical protein